MPCDGIVGIENVNIPQQVSAIAHDYKIRLLQFNLFHKMKPHINIDDHRRISRLRARACEDHSHLLGTAKTDSNGVASLTCSFTLAYDPWRISATFSGTTAHAPSSSEHVDITVLDYTPYLISGGLIAVAIIAVGGYIVFRRRKKQLQDTRKGLNYCPKCGRKMTTTQFCVNCGKIGPYFIPS